MKTLKLMLVGLSLFASCYAQANYLDEVKQIIADIKADNVSLEQIRMLQDLDQADNKIGYALCVANGEKYYNCNSEGSLAYGLCVVSGEAYYNCAAKSKLGYGVCVASGEQYYNCAQDGSLGYGLCVAGGEQYYNCSK